LEADTELDDKDTRDLDDLESDSEDNESEDKVGPEVAPAIAQSDDISLVSEQNTCV
jgi:hypothetical protein